MATTTPESASRIASERRHLALGRTRLCVEDVLALARGEVHAVIESAPEHREKIDRARRVVADARADGRVVYGVTTGVGASAVNAIPDAQQSQLPHRLLQFHGCGTGRFLDPVESAAVVAIRTATLAQGHSGVRLELLERLCALLNERVLPRIPEEGSVGASGDLTPLSYLGALLIGEREAYAGDHVLPAAEALAGAGLSPLALAPKESLAIMNGTSVMTAVACLCFERAERFARLAAAVTAIVVDVTHGNREHFDARLDAAKPHPGQRTVASWLRADLDADAPAPPARLQDRYSLRCAPHVIGVLVDALAQTRAMLETEINGIDDNPLVDPVRGEVVHGGNFYGGHVAFAMDGLKSAIASVADLLDRQLALLCTPETSGGLSANLTATDDVTQHGFKAMQISASALTAEALKLTMPAAAFSRSTESHNQDKVSMGTIAARDCRRVLELAETVGAIGLLAACQAVDLRGPEAACVRARALHAALRKDVAMLREDRRQDLDIERVLGLLREGALPVGSAEPFAAA